MIHKDGFCGHCRTYHYPDYRYWNECPNPFVPLQRPYRPSAEEEHARKMLQIEAEIYQENLHRQREAEKAARQNIREEAKAQDMMKTVHQLQKEAREQATAKILALQAEARNQMRIKAKATRQANSLAEREKVHNQKRAAARTKAQRQSARLARREQERTRSRAEASQPMPARGKDQTGETFFDKDYTSRHALEVKLSTGATKEVT
jgi:hypothetical protein